MPLPDRNPDAILVPRPFLGKPDPHTEFRRRYAPLLGVRRVYATAMPYAHQYFLMKSPDDTLHYPTGHPLAPEPRYDWFVVAEHPDDQPTLAEPIESHRDRPSTVRFGWLRDPEAVVPPSDASRDAWRKQHIQFNDAMKAKVRRRDELLRKQFEATQDGGDLSADERAELQEIEALIL